MKKALFTMMCLLAMMAVGTGLKAQGVTITLNPGWTWISYLGTEPQDFATVLGSFTPTVGDNIMSQWGSASYLANGQWRGSISQFYPGYGYMYKSNRPFPVTVTFNGQPALQMAVTTADPTAITTYGMTCGGEVTDSGNSGVLVRGVCWSTQQNPTIDDPHTTDGYGMGSFSSTVEGLSMNTTYYVRAYAMTAIGTGYGNEITFTTLTVPTWEGVLPGAFSVSADQQVQFSQGNLQYIGSTATPYWKFADHQWDVLGTTTGQNSNAQNVDRDLFGWGTSGWDNGNVYYQPYDCDYLTNGYGYGPTDGTNYNFNLTGNYANADWGVYNSISNGDNQPNQWRTLTWEEWRYIIYTRTTVSGIRYAKANVNNVNGVILLPDDWSASTYTLSNTNNNTASYSGNTISASQWTTLESAGAVFLPAAGDRNWTSVNNVGSFGSYWSASCPNSNFYAYYVSFDDSSISAAYGYGRYYGRSVRLVRVAE